MARKSHQTYGSGWLSLKGTKTFLGFSRHPWKFWSLSIALAVLLPLLVLASSWFQGIDLNHWLHVRAYLLLPMLRETFLLIGGVLIGTASLGLSLSWMCTQYEFWGRAFFQKAFLLPFALPSYVSSFTYVGLFEYSAPFRQSVRAIFGSDQFLPEIKSLPGAIVILTLNFFPYVFMLCQEAFRSQSPSLLEAAQALGCRRRDLLWRVGIGVSKPWLLASLCLVGMEVLNDFGSVSIFGLNTVSTVIYKLWFGFFSPVTAAQLASVLSLALFFLLFVEQKLRQRQRYFTQTSERVLSPPRLQGKRLWLFLSFACLIFFLSALLPLAQLVLWAWQATWDERLWLSLQQSVLVAGLVAGLGTFGALLLAFARRFQPGLLTLRCYQLSQLGYGLPGAVLAVGIYIVLVKIDHALVYGLGRLFSYEGPLPFTGTILALVCALSLRFLAVGSSALDSGLTRISPSLDEAGKGYGLRDWALIRKVHWPLLWKSTALSSLLIFIDSLKEMPLTLMTRPFGWEMLSVRIYSLTSEGEWLSAAPPSLLLVAASCVPLFILSQKEGYS